MGRTSRVKVTKFRSKINEWGGCMKEKVEARIALLEKENKERGTQIQMHGQMKEQLINKFIEVQGAITELKELINPKVEIRNEQEVVK